jgi:hypothetical protein
MSAAKVKDSRLLVFGIPQQGPEADRGEDCDVCEHACWARSSFLTFAGCELEACPLEDGDPL